MRKVAGGPSGRGWVFCPRGGQVRAEGGRLDAAGRDGRGAAHRRQMALREDGVSALSSTLQQGFARFELYSWGPRRSLFMGKDVFAPWQVGALCQHALQGSSRDGRGD